MNVGTFYEANKMDGPEVISSQNQVEAALIECQQCKSASRVCTWPSGTEAPCTCCAQSNKPLCSNFKPDFRTCDQDASQLSVWVTMPGYKGFGMFHICKCFARVLKKHSIANGEERASLGTIGSIVCSKSALGALIAKRLPRNIFWQWDVQSDYVSFLLSSVYQDLPDWSSHDFWCVLTVMSVVAPWWWWCVRFHCVCVDLFGSIKICVYVCIYQSVTSVCGQMELVFGCMSLFWIFLGQIRKGEPERDPEYGVQVHVLDRHA